MEVDSRVRIINCFTSKHINKADTSIELFFPCISRNRLLEDFSYFASCLPSYQTYLFIFTILSLKNC